MTPVLTHEQLLEHWQGHRRLTRRTIEAFPDDTAFATFSVGGMRPFAKLINEFFSMSVPTLVGIVSGEWIMGQHAPPTTREEALKRWDSGSDREFVVSNTRGAATRDRYDVQRIRDARKRPSVLRH